MEKVRKESQAPREEEKALVWGKNPVTELLKCGGAVDTVLLADSMPAAVAGYYTALAKQAGAVVKRAPSGKLQKLCGTTEHQGVAAWAAQVEYTDLEALLDIARQKDEPPFLVLCDGVEDPHNLGAIIRSAYLCGAHGVIIPRRGGVGVTGTVMKSSAGAAARLPVARVANLAQAIRTNDGRVAGALSVSSSVLDMTPEKTSTCTSLLSTACSTLKQYAHLFPAIQLTDNPHQD